MKIVDHNGNPIERAQLKEIQTDQVAKLSGLHNLFAGHPSRGLTPARLARIMENAEQGDMIAQHELFADMEEKDGHIFAEMSKRKRALLTLDWTIAPPRNATAAEKVQAEYVEEKLRDLDNFEDLVLDMLDAIGHGYACLEIEWELLGKEQLPKSFTHRPHSWFQLDRATRSQIRLRDNSLDGAELWPFGWVVHVHRAKSGYLARSGLHRVLAWPFLFKNYSVRDLAEFLEIYGLPLRLGTYPSGASDDEKATLLRAVASIGHDAAGIVPQGMMIEFKEAAKGAADPFQYMMEWCERTQSKAILGGTLTSQADGKSSTNALGNVHNEVRHDLLEADAKQVASTLTRDLVYPILTLNKGGITDRRRLPRFSFDTVEAEDIKTLSESLPDLVDAGAQIPIYWVNEKLRIPVPKENDRILARVQAAPTPQPVAATSVAALTAIADGDEFDVLGDELAGDWERDTDPLIAPIVALAAEVESFEAFQARLPEVMQGMDASKLVEALAQGQFAARIWGKVNAND
jgi:phage gp29-like protein